MAGEAVQVLGLTAVVGLVLGKLSPVLGVSVLQSLAFLDSTTAAAASVVALLSALVARMRVDRRLLTVGRTWAFYGLVVMPLNSVSDTGGAPHLWRAASDAATATFLLLFAHADWGFPMRRNRGPRVVWSGLLIPALAVLAAVQVPVAALGPVVLTSADLIFVTGWALLAFRCVARGLHRAAPVWWRTGFGLGIIAAGQFLAVLNGARSAGGPQIFHLPALRLLGVVVVAASLTWYTRQLVRDRRAQESRRAEQAAVAAHAEAERSHEIRNVLSNLSAMSTLLDRPSDERTERGAAGPAADPGSVAEIINSEFARLHDLLESASAGRNYVGTPVDRVLTRLVTLRRLTGSVITLSCPPGLVAAVPAGTLAQVLTNLLANCARHAPGAEIHVSAQATPGACVIEVTDAGPGLRVLEGETTTAGSGLGLELSARLVDDYGGTLQLMPTTRFPSGTTARICLPLVDSGNVDSPTAGEERSDLESVS